MRNWKIESGRLRRRVDAVLFANAAALLFSMACSSDYTFVDLACEPDGYETEEDCKAAMVELGVVGTDAEAETLAASCCRLTTIERENFYDMDCYPIREAPECEGSADPGDAGGGGGDTLIVITRNLLSVGAALDSAASLGSTREEMATEEVAPESVAQGEASAATAAVIDSKSAAAKRQDGAGTTPSSGIGTPGVLDFNSAGGSGSVTTLSGSFGSSGSGGDSAVGGSAKAITAADASGLIAKLSGGRDTGSSNSGGSGSPEVAADGVTSLDFRKEESPLPGVPAMTGEDPDDYFSRIETHENLFKKVERRIDQKERLWLIQETVR